MRGLMDRFVLLPFSAGCISESSIPVVMQHTKRSKPAISSRTHEEDREEEGGSVNGEESVFGERLKNAFPRFQKLFKSFSQLFAYKDIEMEPEMGLEIGFPADVKHVTHIGLDGCTSSIFPTGWNNSLEEPDLINLHSFTFKQLELAIASEAETPEVKSLLRTRCDSHGTVIAQ